MLTLLPAVIVLAVSTTALGKDRFNVHVSVGWGWYLFYRYAYCDAYTVREGTDNRISVDEITCYLKYTRRLGSYTDTDRPTPDRPTPYATSFSE